MRTGGTVSAGAGGGMYASHGQAGLNLNSLSGYYRAPLFLTAAALQLMVWTAFEEEARTDKQKQRKEQQQKALLLQQQSQHRQQQQHTTITTSNNNRTTSLGSRTPSNVGSGRPGGSPVTNTPPTLPSYRTPTPPVPLLSSPVSVSPPTSYTAITAGPQRNPNAAANLPYPYYQRGLATMLLSASRYRHLRELARLDVNPYASAGQGGEAAAAGAGAGGAPPGDTPRGNGDVGTGGESLEGVSTVLAGGTHPELLSLQKEEVRVIAGLLDYYQWAQYDNHLMDFAERYCRN